MDGMVTDGPEELTRFAFEFLTTQGATVVGVSTKETLAGGPPSTDLEYVLPGAKSAVTFAVPHDKLGEDVAAAVVARDGAELDPRDVRQYAAGRLADFKVPRKVIVLEEIPKGATGKVQRIGLAEKLGLV